MIKDTSVSSAVVHEASRNVRLVSDNDLLVILTVLTVEVFGVLVSCFRACETRTIFALARFPRTAVVAVRLVSPAAATDGLPIFFFEKLATFFSQCRLQSDDLCSCGLVSSPLSPSDVVYPVFFLN